VLHLLTVIGKRLLKNCNPKGSVTSSISQLKTTGGRRKTFIITFKSALFQQLKCANCTGNHSAFSKSCLKINGYLNKVQQVKAERNISFAEARKIVSAEGQSSSIPGNHSAAAVVGTKSMPIRSHSVPVQTDLTWSEGQVEPFILPASACTTSQQSTQTTTEKSSRSKNTGDAQPYGKGQSLSAHHVSHDFKKPANKGNVKKRPRLTRPP